MATRAREAQLPLRAVAGGVAAVARFISEPLYGRAAWGAFSQTAATLDPFQARAWCQRQSICGW
eukprot:2477865-Pleurochrysis_carterae.AAC.1